MRSSSAWPRARRLSTVVSCIGLLSSIGVRLGAQSATLPPIHDFSAPIARAADSIGATGMLIALSDGRVVINDVKRKKVVILDKSLAHPMVVADTNGGTQLTYGARGGTLLRYLGDTILFADPASQTFHVISPVGDFVRDVPFPSGDVPLVGNGQPLGMRVDQNGTLTFWTRSGGPCGEPGSQDSNAVYRTQLGAGTVTTVGFARHDVCPRNAQAGQPHPVGSVPPTVMIPIVQHRDEWAVLSDGTVALVRDPSFTIDWVASDGSQHSSPPVAQPYVLSATEKAALVDSMSAMFQAHPVVEHSISFDANGQQASSSTENIVPQVIDPGASANVAPAFGDGMIRVDADDNLWVVEADAPVFTTPLTTAPVGTPLTPQNTPRPALVYDLINRNGVIVDRVRLPSGFNLIAFGPGGVAYVTNRDGDNLQLVRLRIR